jgi:type I restriction enzyme S subunit
VSARLRDIAEVNPPTPEFQRLSSEAPLTFMPLETVWADARLDMSRVRRKSEVVAGYTRFRNGDILLPKVTPTFQAGRSAIVDRLVSGVGAGTTELHVLRARPGNDTRYLRYLVQSENFLTEGVAAFQGVAGLQRVPSEFVKNFSVPSLALDEQHRVADFLDRESVHFREIVTLRRRQIDAVESRLGAKLVKDLLPDRTQGWRRTRLKYLFELERNGLWGDEPGGDDSDRLCIRVADFDRQRFVSSRSARTLRSVDKLQAARHELRPGDILLEKSGGGDKSPVGFAVNFEGQSGSICSNFITQLRPNRSTDPRFVGLLMAALHIAGRNAPFVKQTTGIQNLDGAAYLGQEVFVPSKSIQQRISRDLDKHVDITNDLISTAASQLDLIAERWRSLVSMAVSGRLEGATAREVTF